MVYEMYYHYSYKLKSKFGNMCVYRELGNTYKNMKYK